MPKGIYIRKNKRILSEDHKIKIGNGNRNKKRSKLQKEHCSIAMKKFYKTHKHHSLGTTNSFFTEYNKTRNQKGENNSNWKGNKAITPLVMRLRMCSKYKLWRSDVFERDNYTCQICGKKGYKLNADHIKSFSSIIKENKINSFERGINCEELWNRNNGRTLCFSCHIKTENFANGARKK